MKLKTITALFCMLVLSATKICAQNNAIRFDGSTEYIQLASQINVANNNFTFEAWVKPNSTTNGMVFGQDVNGNTNHQFRLAIQGSRARFYFTGNSASPSISISSAASTVPTNQWTHVAVVRSGTTVTLYLNGVSAATGTSMLINNQSGADASKPFRIGARGGTGNPNGQNNFDGSIDEFRYWNVARTAAEIKANLYYPPSASATSLVLWYRMDAGSGSSAVNTATNVLGNNGTLINTPTWVASPIAYAQNSIHLDGSSDMVSIGVPLLNNASFTKEAWVYANANTGNLNLVSSSGSPFWINAGKLKAGFGGNIEVITDPGNFPLNTWTHVAVTFDDPTNTMRLYRDGTLVATNSSLSASYSGENMYIGSWQGTMSFFEGRIDEVRIWNVARTAAQIQNSRNMEILPAAEANLVSYYTFNQGITNGTNAGINTVIDQKGSFNGTISGLALSGLTSNFVSQYASLALLPLRWKTFTASRQEKQVLLNWETEGEINTSSFLVQHSLDGIHWNQLATLAAAGESNSVQSYQYIHPSPSIGPNYYRIRQVDLDAKFTFSEIRKVIFSSTQKSFLIKSNPIVNGILELQINDAVQISIYGMKGDLWLRKYLHPGAQRINLQTLPKGMYILKAGTNTEKIVL